MNAGQNVFLWQTMLSYDKWLLPFLTQDSVLDKRKGEHGKNCKGKIPLFLFLMSKYFNNHLNSDISADRLLDQTVGPQIKLGVFFQGLSFHHPEASVGN